jgi:formylglycine-generating enzyme required for sulfatase activity
MTRKRTSFVRTSHVFLAATAVLSLSYAQAADPAPGSTFRDCPTCPEIVVVPAGEFVMGSTLAETGHTDEKPQHTVRIAQAFGVGKFEISFDQWDACTKAGRCPAANDDGFGRGKYPALNVSWVDAKAYTAWMRRHTQRG